MLNTAIVFFLGMAIGYFFAQQKAKEKEKIKQSNMAPQQPEIPVEKDQLKIIRK